MFPFLGGPDKFLSGSRSDKRPCPGINKAPKPHNAPILPIPASFPGRPGQRPGERSEQEGRAQDSNSPGQSPNVAGPQSPPDTNPMTFKLLTTIRRILFENSCRSKQIAYRPASSCALVRFAHLDVVQAIQEMWNLCWSELSWHKTHDCHAALAPPVFPRGLCVSLLGWPRQIFVWVAKRQEALPRNKQSPQTPDNDPHPFNPRLFSPAGPDNVRVSEANKRKWQRIPIHDNRSQMSRDLNPLRLQPHYPSIVNLGQTRPNILTPNRQNNILNQRDSFNRNQSQRKNGSVGLVPTCNPTQPPRFRALPGNGMSPRLCLVLNPK